MSVQFLNWLYFFVSVLFVIWATHRIWRISNSPSSRGKTYYQKYYDKNLKGISRIVKFIWRKHYKLAIFILTLLISWILLYADNIFSIENIPPKDELTGWVLLITAAIVFWYTRETYDLKENSRKQLQETRNQIDIQLKPYLRIQWNNEDNNKVYDIVNEGEGMALEVKFRPIKFQDQDIESVFQIKSRPLIAKSKPTSVTTSELVNPNNIINQTTNIKGYIEQKSDLGYYIQATYLDAEERKYKVVFRSDDSYNDRFRIVEQGRVE